MEGNRINSKQVTFPVLGLPLSIFSFSQWEIPSLKSIPSPPQGPQVLGRLGSAQSDEVATQEKGSFSNYIKALCN